jgi:glucose/mannose-6-phosphate isomerase
MRNNALNQTEKKELFSTDPSGMAAKIRELPEQLKRGWEIGGQADAGESLRPFRHVVYSGMGGSAIAGDMVRALLKESLAIPFVVKRGYELPPFAGPETLFIASSYSGDTEETLSATRQAVEKGCRVVCITSGGALGQLAAEKKFPLFVLPKGYPPRGALGFGLGTLLRLFTRMNAAAFTEGEFNQAVAGLERFGRVWADPADGGNEPFAVAKKLAGKIPMVYADVNRLDAVGFRWKTQFNENSKTHAFYAPVPEMNHNEIIGWETVPGTRPFFSALTAVLLRAPEEHPRVALRMEITKDLISKNKGSYIEVAAKGGCFLERMLYLVSFGDWVSLYLALLYGADPTEIDNIIYLKNKLS